MERDSRREEGGPGLRSDAQGIKARPRQRARPAAHEASAQAPTRHGEFRATSGVPSPTSVPGVPLPCATLCSLPGALRSAHASHSQGGRATGNSLREMKSKFLKSDRCLQQRTRWNYFKENASRKSPLPSGDRSACLGCLLGAASTFGRGS